MNIATINQIGTVPAVSETSESGAVRIGWFVSRLISRERWCWPRPLAAQVARARELPPAAFQFAGLTDRRPGRGLPVSGRFQIQAEAPVPVTIARHRPTDGP